MCLPPGPGFSFGRDDNAHGRVNRARVLASVRASHHLPELLPVPSLLGALGWWHWTGVLCFLLTQLGKVSDGKRFLGRNVHV